MSGFSIKIIKGNVEISQNLAVDYDNFFIDNNEITIVFEGLLLNKSLILKNNFANDFETLFINLFNKKGIAVLKELEGEFRGLIFDKRQQKLFVFTNPTATQKVYYSASKFGFFVDTQLKNLNSTLCQFEKTSPDLVAIYQLLAIGNMLENNTPIRDVYKLLDGHFLEIDLDGRFKEIQYFSASSSKKFDGTMDEAINLVNENFDKSISLEYQKDTELGSNHLSLLSGGLDSRIALFSALLQNFISDRVLCFSQSGYHDATISRKIANDFHLPYEFVPLDDGKYLCAIDEVAEIGDGCTVFYGAPHVFHAVKQLKFQDFKIFHSGQIGDGILGGFNSAPNPVPPSFFKIIEDSHFLPKIEKKVKKIIQKYDTEEEFLLRNLAFNRTVLGAKVFQQKAIQTSPFMTKDFMTLALSLPEKWKFGHRFYLNWVNKCFPEATKYRWERTLMKPDAHWKTHVGDRFLKPLNKKLFSQILKVPSLASMYPYQMYYDNSLEIQGFYNDYYNENFHRLEAYTELAEDVRILFNSREYFSKAKALHILAVFKMFF